MDSNLTWHVLGNHEDVKTRAPFAIDIEEHSIAVFLHEGQLHAIVGVELFVERIEAKDKLSQNRPGQDRAGVIAALRAEPADGARAIADLMAGREARMRSATCSSRPR